MVATPRLPRQRRREELREGSTVATEPKILLVEKSFMLHSGDAVSPQQLNYSGAPCPICYEDLGVNVPKGTKFDIAVKTCKEIQRTEQLKTMGESCA
jgi:hypothetical protein